MPQTTQNLFDLPASTDAPDGPGGLFTLGTQLDGRLGAGGAEAVASYTALTALPTNRLFLGKIAFLQDSGIRVEFQGGGLWTALAHGRGTALERAAAPAAVLWGGFEFTETDTGNTYRWNGTRTRWELWNMETWLLGAAITLGTGWTSLQTPGGATTDSSDGGFKMVSGMANMSFRMIRATGQATVTADSAGNIGDLNGVVSFKGLATTALQYLTSGAKYGRYGKQGVSMGSARVTSSGIDFTDTYPTSGLSAGDGVQVDLQFSPYV